MSKPFLCVTLSILLLAGVVAADIDEYLLPNGEPIVGVYYYSWFAGEPYRHVSWTPEFEYDNKVNQAHIYEVVKAMTDYGINQASYSYWDNDGYFRSLGAHLKHAERLLNEGRECYFSPYLEPRTVDKVFASPEAQAANADFISTYLEEYGSHPSFCSIGGTPLTNIYVTYNQPDESDADFRAFLEGKYGTIDALRKAWTAQEGYEAQMLAADAVPGSFGEITLGMAQRGTVAMADRQQLRARRLQDGWGAVIDGVKGRTGFDTRYTGDVSNTIVSPTEYMKGLTGMSWYSFGYALTDPVRRPKLISEISKYTNTVFLNTISPGYVDRQQRWTGGRVERSPYLYPYAWTRAIQSLPEGIMILTHSEWFEGSIIDVTKEYGKNEYESTELYSSVFRGAFGSIYEHKRDKEPVAVVFNEWATYGIQERGANLEDVYGLIKLLECLNLEYDVIPESALTAGELAGRRLVFVPNCGASLKPGNNEMLLRWARNTEGATLVVDESTWWAKALGLGFGAEKAPIRRYRCANTGQWIEPLGDSFQGLKITDMGACFPVGESEGDAPKILGKALQEDGRGVVFFNGRLGGEFHSAFLSAAEEGRVPAAECQAARDLLEDRVPGLMRQLPSPPNPGFEVKSGPALAIGDTTILPAGNVLPWGYIAQHRSVGWGLDQGHSAETTKPWEPVACSFNVGLKPNVPVAEVMVLDSDGRRMAMIEKSERKGNSLTFDWPMKFQGMFAVVQSPVRITTPELSISPGQTRSFAARVENLTRRNVECLLRLKRTPGLTMEEVAFTLASGATRELQMELAAGTDYASGDRTICLELAAGNRMATLWRGVHCTLPASVGTRTTVLGGVSGEEVTRQVTLANVGEAPAEGVRVALLDGEAEVGDLAPGDERTVAVRFTVPGRARSERAPDKSVSLTLGAGKKSEGLSTRSGGDGVFSDVTAGGRPASIAAGGQDGRNDIRMIYLWVDDAVLPAGEYDLEAVVEYLDQGTDSFMIEYDSVDGDEVEHRYKDSRRVSLMATNTWKTAVIPLTGARLAGRQNGGADLRVNGVVPVGKITLRGLRAADMRMPQTLKVSYEQFGHAATQELRLDVMAQAQRPAADAVWRLNPYGGNVRGYSNGAPGGGEAGQLTVTDKLREAGLVVVENAFLSATWDDTRGGLVSLYSKQTKTDYAAFPGHMLPVMVETEADGAQYFAGGRVARVEGGTVEESPTNAMPGDTLLVIEDTWQMAANEPRLTLERTLTARTDVAVADFAPAVLRLTPDAFDQLLPLGVGFQKEGQPKRGWLETWHSDGWYFAFSGSPEAAGHGLAMTVRASETDGIKPIRRFRYGFFPGESLPTPATGGVADDEIQIRLRGPRSLKAQESISLTVDLFVLPGGSYREARELALLNATPVDILERLTVTGDAWDAVGGVQTIMPTAPNYMFNVRQPYYSAALEGEE